MSRRTMPEATALDLTATLQTPLTRRRILRGARAVGAAGAGTGWAVRRARPAAASDRPAPAVLRGSFQAKATVEVWDQQQSDKNIQDAYTAALASFQQANPDIEVKIT